MLLELLAGMMQSAGISVSMSMPSDIARSKININLWNIKVYFYLKSEMIIEADSNQQLKRQLIKHVEGIVAGAR